MAKYKITFNDALSRFKLGFANLTRYIFNIEKSGPFLIPSEYKKIFYDYFENDWKTNWEDGSTWWGQPYHPGNLTCWFDPEQIKLISTSHHSASSISFSAVEKSRNFGAITIPNAVGVMRSRASWKYGIFLFEAILPSGVQLWPALWLTGVANWPPEIDLLEGYSDGTNDYHNNRNLQSNIHMSDGQGGNYAAGACTHRLPNKVTEDFITYIIWWERDFIKLYYNGYLVREITDPEVLNAMSEAQQIIIGTGVQQYFNLDNLTPMIVKNVSVYQK